MQQIMEAIRWFQDNWVTIGVALWSIEKGLEIIVTLTPWKGDDNLGVIVGNVLRRIFPKSA